MGMSSEAETQAKGMLFGPGQEFLNATKAKTAEFGPGGVQSVDNMWAKIAPYYSKAIQDANEYGGAQLGALRGSYGSQLVEGGVAPGSQLNSAFLSAISPVIAELAKFKGSISATEGGALQNLIQSNAQMQLGAQQEWGSGLGYISNFINSMKKTTQAGDLLGGIQTGVNTASGIQALIKGF